MTDDPRSHQYNDADWEYEVDSVQRGGVTGQTKARRHGKVTTPEPTDGNKPNDKHSQSDDSERGSDEYGIPVQFKD
jgi:hypothetical protein